MSAAARQVAIERYGREAVEKGWQFLTGDEASIARLCDAAGFRYRYDEQKRQFAHATGVFVLAPNGTLSRFLSGVEFSPRDLRLSIVAASAGKVGSPIHKVLLFCYDYDPTTGRYTLAVTYLIRVVGTLTALGLGAYVAAMLWRDRRRALLAQRGPIADLIEPRSA